MHLRRLCDDLRSLGRVQSTFLPSYHPTQVKASLVFKCFYSILKIYNFRNIVHYLKCILQVVDNAVFWQSVSLHFEKRGTQSEFLDVFYCGHVTYQIWAWFETFKQKRESNKHGKL